MLILWPRLLETIAKPQWLKVDFDRIKQDDMDTTSDSEVEELAKNRGSYNPRVYKDRNFGRGRKNRGSIVLITVLITVISLMMMVHFHYCSSRV